VGNILIKNATIVNENKIFSGDVLIRNERIEKIDTSITDPASEIIDATGLILLPGVIDDQVHFREPGLVYKGDLYTEPKSAVAGGTTSFMEMPNTIPNTLTRKFLEQKFDLAAEKSLANFSFYMGASNDNYDELMRTDKKKVCGIKIFMGSSTGDMLVDNKAALEKVFSGSEMLIATHCEDEPMVCRNLEEAKAKFGENIPVWMHPVIRNEEACYHSSSFAVSLAKKYGTRLHILHISTAKELSLFDNSIPLGEKKITAEACIHHLWFDDSDYERLGMKIKWNPAIKTAKDKEALLMAVIDGKIDVIATDHAPHTAEEKTKTYLHCPSGGPLVQHSLVAMLEFYHNNKLTLEKIVQKMSHDVAECFCLENRGYIREGYFADLVLIDLNQPWKVSQENILAKCGWSPFENQQFRSKVIYTFVNGHPVYQHGKFDESKRGMRLTFH
jgi:dihydroorotase